MRGLSRREFLGGAAGVAAAVALPPFHPARAAITPLAGATVNLASYHVSNYVHAADIFDGYVGLPMATAIQKIYLGHDSFPSTPSDQDVPALRGRLPVPDHDRAEQEDDADRAVPAGGVAGHAH